MTVETENAVEVPRLRAVIVDDAPDVRYLLATILEVDGRFEVVGEAHTASDGVEVVLATEPDLVLIDLQLEGRDGIWLITELRRRGVDAALAVVTGSAIEHATAPSVDAGADAVVNKMAMTSTMIEELLASVSARRGTDALV